MMVLVIGLSGVTCSGKTSLTTLLEECFASKSLHMDDYFLPEADPRHELVPSLGHINWELHSSLDLDQMYTEAKQLIAQVEKTGEASLVILEGFLVLNEPRLTSLCQLRFFMDVPYEHCRDRRAVRVYEPADVPGYFDQVAWPASQRYKDEVLSQVPSVVMLDGLQPLQVNLDKVSKLISTAQSVQLKS